MAAHEGDQIRSWQRFSVYPSDDPDMQNLFEFKTDVGLPGPHGSFAEVTVASTAQGKLVVIKSASTSVETSTEPHDIARELRILSGLLHPNVNELIGYHCSNINDTLHLWTSYVPYGLMDVLGSPAFFPDIISFRQDNDAGVPPSSAFVDLAKSLQYQLVSAVAYLHSQEVAHRDLKPANVLVTPSGYIKLIDFGVSWSRQLSSSDDCLWPEPPGSLCFDVCTGHYRAPELLFGVCDYDPYATDLWSLGVLYSEFFTTIENDDSNSDFGSDEEYGPQRASLFNSERGSIGLAWSIFQIRGTPTAESWPSFASLPDSSKVTFQDVPPVDLQPLLPNLPTGDHPTFTGSHRLPHHPSSSPLDLIYRLLAYTPEDRLAAREALSHPWFTSTPLLLPADYPLDSDTLIRRESSDRQLGDIFMRFTCSSTSKPYDSESEPEDFQEEE